MSVDRQELKGLPTRELATGRERMRAVVSELMSITAITPVHDISPDDPVDLAMAKLDYNVLAIRALPTMRRLFDLARRDFEELNTVFTERLIGEAEKYEQTVAAARERASSITASAEAHPEYAPAAQQASAFVSRLEGMVAADSEQGTYLREGLQLLAERRAKESASAQETRVEKPQDKANEQPAEPEVVDSTYAQKVAIVAAIVEEISPEGTESKVNWDQVVAALGPEDAEDDFERAVAVRGFLLDLPGQIAERVAQGTASAAEQALFARLQTLANGSPITAVVDGQYADWFNTQIFGPKIETAVETMSVEAAFLEEIAGDAEAAEENDIAAAAAAARLAVGESLDELVSLQTSVTGKDKDEAQEDETLASRSEEEDDEEAGTRRILSYALTAIEARAGNLFLGAKMRPANAQSIFPDGHFDEATIAAMKPYLHLKRGSDTLGIRDIAFLLALGSNPPIQGENLAKMIDRQVIDRQVHLILDELEKRRKEQFEEPLSESTWYPLKEAARILGFGERVNDLLAQHQQIRGEGPKTQKRYSLRNVVLYLCSKRSGQGNLEPDQITYAMRAYAREIAAYPGASARRRA